MRENFVYPVEFETDEDGDIVVTFPDFSYGATSGTDRKEALSEATDCLATLLAGCIEDGTDIPSPSPARGRPTVTPPALVAAKAALYAALRKGGLSEADMARRMGVDSVTIHRWLDVDDATDVAVLEAALRSLGRRLEVRVSAA